MSDVVIIDYGMGNLKSIQRGLEKVDANVTLSTDSEVIATADRLVLPGVGAFESGMLGLKDREITDAIYAFVKTGNPLLGICLGMQMFLDKSEEHGNHQGLGLIPGIVKKIPESDQGKFQRKVPHIGWTNLHAPVNGKWKNSCLEEIEQGEYFYFVHSYMAVPEKKEHTLAECKDEGLTLTAAVKKDNIIGLQFHPEKSGEVGLKILKTFVNN
jgi:imidazole glycerol-phosphate synthase subunit HisH